MRIAVVGARGQLGTAILRAFEARHDMVPFGRDALDVADDRAVAAAMARVRPDAIINCAAYNDVDGAEDHPVEALNANAFAVRALARAEDAPRAYVLRVESLFGRAAGGGPSKGSVATIVKTLLAGGEARVFEDRTVSATYIIDAAAATLQLVEKNAPAGLYHCVNSGHCTWLEFAQELATQLGVEPRLVPVRMAGMTLRAPRPLYCALSTAKIAAAGAPMPTWQDAVRRFAAEFRT
jgi:dTDP-4-dehydrorhamnose reductase